MKFRGMRVLGDPALRVVRGVAQAGPYSMKVASAREMETAPFLVCLEWSDPPAMAGNVRARCGGCGRSLQHRPQAPKAPPKLCLECAAVWATATHH